MQEKDEDEGNDKDKPHESEEEQLHSKIKNEASTMSYMLLAC